MALNNIQSDILLEIFRLLLMPRQIFHLRAVCKCWKDLIDTLLNAIPFLSLDNALLAFPNKRVVMAMAPVNSSGDIYHMLAFVILALERKAQIAPILLGYDQKAKSSFRVKQNELNTGMQVKRALNFISYLGYEDCFFPSFVSYSSGQPPARQSALEMKLQNLMVTHYIDHRLSTSVIADHFRQYDFAVITAILRRGFRKRTSTLLLSSSYQNVTSYVEECIQEIKDIAQTGQPTLIIHNRISSKSNSEQSLSSLITPVVIALKAKKYNVIVIYADSRLKGYNASNIEAADMNIRPFQETTLVNDQEDLGKLAHLELLIRLYDIKSEIDLRGIIGNTSGTLDLAAFIGHRVFNIHHFDYLHFDYQDYRVFLQMCFFVVERDDTTYINNKLLKDIESWLNNNEAIPQPKQHLHLAKPSNYTGLGKVGFCFFSSVKNIQQNRWEPQRFFQDLKIHVNGKCQEANLLENAFEPPQPN